MLIEHILYSLGAEGFGHARVPHRISPEVPTLGKCLG